jgi:hypothetical protein
MLRKLPTRKDNQDRTYDNEGSAARNDGWCEEAKLKRERQR